MARRKSVLSDLLGRGRGAVQNPFMDLNVEIGANLITQGRIDKYLSGQDRFGGGKLSNIPSAYDPISGALTGSYVSKLFGPNTLADPIAQNYLQGAAAFNASRGRETWDSYDLVAAAATSNYVKGLLSRTGHTSAGRTSINPGYMAQWASPTMGPQGSDAIFAAFTPGAIQQTAPAPQQTETRYAV